MTNLQTTDQNMAQSKQNSLSKLTIEEMQGINLLVDHEKDRSFCKKLMSKIKISDLDVFDVRNVVVRNFVANCNNYGVNIPATIIGNDERKDFIKQVQALHLKESSTFNHRDYVISDWIKVDSFLLALNKLNKGEQHKQCRLMITSINDKWCSTFFHNSNNDCRKLISKFDGLKISSRIKSMSQFQKKMKYYYHTMGNTRSHNEFINEYEDQMFKLASDLPAMRTELHEATDEIKQTCSSVRNYINNEAPIITEAITNASARLTETSFKISATARVFSSKFDKLIMNCETITGKFLQILDGWDTTSTYVTFFIHLIKFVSFSYLAAQKK